jgi:hypothetical protein
MQQPSQPSMIIIASFITGVAFFGLNGSDIYRQIVERQHRNEVLARGKSAVATVQKQSSYESVVISWTDSTGETRTAEAMTGKAFARSAPLPNHVSTRQRVDIRYVDDPSVNPVVLSEVVEREKFDNFRFYWTPLFYVLSGFGLAGVLWLSTKL